MAFDTEARKTASLGSQAHYSAVKDLLDWRESVIPNEFYLERRSFHRIQAGLPEFPVDERPSKIKAMRTEIEELKSRLAHYQQSEFSAMVS